MALLWIAATASADLSFCPPGTGPGQCENPQGVAVDQEDELVYVADRSNNRVNVFNTQGVFQTSFGTAQLDRPMGIAVDNSGGASTGDVYVLDGSQLVFKFKADGAFVGPPFGTSGECQISTPRQPIAVGPGGVVYVGDSEGSESSGFFNRIEQYSESGTCLKEVDLFQGSRPLIALAVDSSANTYVIDDSGVDGIRKYDPTGALLYKLEEVPLALRLGIDEADDLFAVERDGLQRTIAEYDPSGKTLRRFGYDAIQRGLRGIAPFHSAMGEVFGSEEFAEVKYFTLPPPGPIVPSSTVQASPVSNTKATLKAQINPEGKETAYHFEYVDQESFEKEGGFASPKTQSTPAGSIAMVAGTEFRLHPVQAQVGCLNVVSEASKCLEPDTAYRFRAVATNADNPSPGTIAEATFKTKPPFEVEIFATEVGVDTARIHAEVNPLGLPTTGHFEYVEEAKFNLSGFAEARRFPAGEIDFGSGEAPVAASATISLTPGTTYRYRLLADDPLIEPTAPEERVLKTFALLQAGQDGPCANEDFRTEAGAFLADCRGYELVSPLDKNNGDVIPPAEGLTELPAALQQSSPSGNRLAYSTYRAFGEIQSAPYAPQYVAARDPETGWHSHGISPPRGRPMEPSGVQADTEFKYLSPDLCDAWIRTVAEPVLAPGGTPRFPNLYRRHDDECGGASFEAVTKEVPSHETEVGLYPAQHYIKLELVGVSADGGEAIYTVPEKLTANAPAQTVVCVKELEKEVDTNGANCRLRLYQYGRADQSTHYVCVLPGGVASQAPCGAGRPVDGARSRENHLDNAISDDGSRVFWTTFASDPAPGPIFMRENPGAEQGTSPECSAGEPGKACTVSVSKKGEELSGTSASTYWGAAADGSKAFYTSGELAGGADFYEFEVESKTTTLIAHEVTGVMGASEDASRIYFASREALDAGAVAGKPNLYLYEEGTLTLAALLAEADSDVLNLSPLAIEPSTRLSRVSEDGLHAAFTSFGQLTGYDNTDAISGVADAEVFLYDASANGGEGKLVCASCNPTGGRPAGGVVRIGKFPIQAAATIPPWENTLHAQRVLSDDGTRLYFTSSDVLSPRDTNGKRDVYQWEAVGAGGCDASDPSFSTNSAGCISLISSGKSGADADIVEISPSGDDVFFSTLSSLVSQDYGLVDIYDARVGGGFPPPESRETECEGEACQSPPAPPQAPTPSTASHQGPGNVKEGDKSKRCAKGKRKVKKGNKTRCVKASKKSKSKAKSKAKAKR